MRYAMIMAGGSGTRLWPMSTSDRPKQLVPMIEQGGARRSLLELADARLEGLIEPSRRYICTGERFRDAVRGAMPAYDDAHILGEPVGRDTLNAVGFAAAVLERLDPDATLAVLTGDHLIEPREEFRRAMETAFEVVERDGSRLVTFSIEPTYPATGFGYVQRGGVLPGFADAGGAGRAFVVERFTEKPDAATAEAFLRRGGYGWNSGMFVWKASVFMRCLERYAPESHAGLRRIGEAWGADAQRATIERVYPTLPKISVDYAVLEPASREPGGPATVCTVPMRVRWVDVGTWANFARTRERDARGNAAMGRTLLHECDDTLVVNEGDDGHLVAVLGCEGLVVVRTPQATLVMPASRAEELKALHARLPERHK